MKITVRIAEIEIVIDRSSFSDYDYKDAKAGQGWRKNLMNDTIIPTLKEATDRAKELYLFKAFTPNG